MSVEMERRKEKRRITRRHLVFYLRVFDGMSSRVLGHMIDISENGLMLLSDDPMAVNEEHRLRMGLPWEIAGSEEVIFKAVSRWSRPDENPDFFMSGFQIKDIDREARELIRFLIDEFGIAEDRREG